MASADSGALKVPSTDAPAPGALRRLLGRHGWWLVVAFAVLAAAAIRVRLLEVPLERDEGEYAYAGQLLLHGVLPFKLAYNMKLPGTYLAYAGSMGLFGETITGIRLGLVLVNAATTVLLFLLGRRVLGAFGGAAAAASFATLSLATGVLGPFAHATHYVLLPAVAGILVLLAALESRSFPKLVFAGLLLGTAVLMKQPGAVFPLFALAWLSWTRLRQRPSDRVGHWGRDALVLSAGTAIPLAATVLALAAGGVFGRFWFWVVRYGREYASSVPLALGLEQLGDAVRYIVPQAAILWGLAAAGLAALALPQSGLRCRTFLLGFLAFSFLGVCPGLHFRPHYFILALPAVSLLVGAALEAGRNLLPAAARRAWSPALVAVLAAACAQPVYARRAEYFRLSPDRVSRSIYGENPFPEALEIARYVRERTRPDDTIAVLGSEPEIFFYADRRSATGYIYTYSLLEMQPLARAMQEEMIREIEAARPAYAVWVGVPWSWLPKPGSERLVFDWANFYLRAHYDVCGEIAILGPERTLYLWDDAAAKAPAGVPRVTVLRRKGFVPPSGAARAGLARPSSPDAPPGRER